MLFSNVKEHVFWFLQICVHYSLCPDPLPLLFIFPEGRGGGGVGVCTQAMLLVFFFTIGHFSNEEGTGAEMRPHLLLGSLMERGSQSLTISPLSLVTVPEVFAKVDSA